MELGLLPVLLREMLDCVSCDDGLRILQEHGCMEETLRRVVARVEEMLGHRGGDELETGAIMFSKVYGCLGETSRAQSLLKKIKEE